MGVSWSIVLQPQDVAAADWLNIVLTKGSYLLMSVFVCRCTVTWTQTKEGGWWVFELKSSSHSWVFFSMNTSCWTFTINHELSEILCVYPAPRCSRGGWTARWTSTGPGITTRRALVPLLESTGSVRNETKLTVMWLHETVHKNKH